MLTTYRWQGVLNCAGQSPLPPWGGYALVCPTCAEVWQLVHTKPQLRYAILADPCPLHWSGFGVTPGSLLMPNDEAYLDAAPLEFWRREVALILNQETP